MLTISLLVGKPFLQIIIIDGQSITSLLQLKKDHLDWQQALKIF